MGRYEARAAARARLVDVGWLILILALLPRENGVGFWSGL
jgi:hypothetical protein